MTAERHADSGVSTISEGNDAVLGVWRGGRTGLVTAAGMLSTLSECIVHRDLVMRKSHDGARGARATSGGKRREQAVGGEKSLRL